METEGIFSRACRTANTIASLAATATTTSSPTTGTISVPIKTATDRASGTLHRSNRPIEAEALITSTRACGTASTIVNLAATAGITSSPTGETMPVPTKTATSTASGTLHTTMSRTIEADALITSSGVCGTASTIVSMVATAGITSNPTTRTTSAPTETATNTDIATSPCGTTNSFHAAG